MTLAKNELNADPLGDIFKIYLDKFSSEFYCHRIGKILNFNINKQTADVEILDIAKKKDGTLVSIQPILNCPVMIDRGNTRPINKGDLCLIHFNDVDIDKWYSTNATQVPNTARKHNINDDAIVQVIDISNELNPIESYNNQKRVLQWGKGKIEVGDKIKIANDQTDFKTFMSTFFDNMKLFKVIDPISGLLPLDSNSINYIEQAKQDFLKLFE